MAAVALVVVGCASINPLGLLDVVMKVAGDLAPLMPAAVVSTTTTTLPQE